MGKARRKQASSSIAFAAALIAFASLRIVSTYTVFNHTFDEPAHIACGMEWLDHQRGVKRIRVTQQRNSPYRQNPPGMSAPASYSRQM